MAICTYFGKKVQIAMILCPHLEADADGHAIAAAAAIAAIAAIAAAAAIAVVTRASLA